MKTLEIMRSKGFRGRFRFPGDKSITHRCVLLASLAVGVSEVHHPGTGDDCLRSILALSSLGVGVERQSDSLKIFGIGSCKSLITPKKTIDCGNSGTSARLLLGLLAGTSARAVITGDRSLRGRPMTRVVSPLTEMKARIRYLGTEGRLPLEVIGNDLRGAHISLSVPSAQVKSAILVAALRAEGETRVLQSPSTRDHAERLLVQMGSGLYMENGWIVQPPVSRLEAFDLDIPGDPSSAAFFAVGAGIHKGSEVILENISLNPHRTKFLEVLSRMGAEVTIVDFHPGKWEPSGDVRVRGGELAGVTIEPEEIPGLIDEIPALAVAMAVADGESRILGAGELRLKESDRLAVLARELAKFGVPIVEFPDGLLIEGGGLLQAPVHSSPSGDHRLAMALAILGTVAEGTTRVRQSECIRVSFPEFEFLLRKVTSG